MTRVFDAPLELVWEAFTDSKQFVKWWGPNGCTTTIREVDVRPGGVLHDTMHGPDGTDYPNRSVYTEIVKHERISGADADGDTDRGGPSTMTWTFEEMPGGKTKLTLRTVFTSAATLALGKTNGFLEGSKQVLSRLEEYLAGNLR